MTDPIWKGAARPRSDAVLAIAADRLGCEVATLKAVLEVEAAGNAFRADGTLERRFEPHKMDSMAMSYAASRDLSRGDREALFLDAAASDQEAACAATSWGSPQIMGFNHDAAGYASAVEMVKSFAMFEDVQIEAMARLIDDWGLATALRAHDWHEFARGYNGPAAVGEYAPRLEAAWRRISGRRSPEVLREGDRGAPVRRLQRALGIRADGDFGPATTDAVRRFQRARDLAVDGIAGRRTWAALTDKTGRAAPAQKQPADAVIDAVKDHGVTASGVAGLLETARRALPEGVWAFAGYAAVAAGVALAALWIVSTWRRRA